VPDPGSQTWRAAGGERLDFRVLSELSGQERLVPVAASLIHEAGNPYFDWFFGGPEAARAAVVRWIERPSSELAASRVTLLFAGGRAAGVFVALGGAELAVCRKADALAALAEAGKLRSALVARMAIARELFVPVVPEDFYLSKIGIVAELRRRGLGRALMAEYLAAGLDAGFERFCLDVSADNEHAIWLYRSFGFRVEARTDAAGMSYLRMGLDHVAPGLVERRRPPRSLGGLDRPATPGSGSETPDGA